MSPPMNHPMSHPWLSIVIPVFNEQVTLNDLVTRLLRVCEPIEQTGKQCEIILVDDGSRDRSRQLIRDIAKKHPNTLKGIFLNRNYGQHAAVMAGFAESRGEVIVTLDADLQNPPEEIPKLLAPIKAGCDVVGSRRLNRQDSWFRRFFSRLVNKTVQRSTGVAMSDYGCMLRAYRRPIIDAMLDCHERSTFIPVLANLFANQTAEVEVHHAGRENSDSKYTLLKLINLQFDLLTSMTTAPLRWLSLIGGGIALLGFLLAGVLILSRLIYGAPWAAEGVFTLFSALFVFIGAQFIGLGLLGEYIGRIFNDVRGRPRYIVKEVVDLAHTPQAQTQAQPQSQPQAQPQVIGSVAS